MVPEGANVDYLIFSLYINHVVWSFETSYQQMKACLMFFFLIMCFMIGSFVNMYFSTSDVNKKGIHVNTFVLSLFSSVMHM